MWLKQLYLLLIWRQNGIDKTGNWVRSNLGGPFLCELHSLVKIVIALDYFLIVTWIIILIHLLVLITNGLLFAIGIVIWSAIISALDLLTPVVQKLVVLHLYY